VLDNGHWSPIDAARRYGVVSNNFLRSGGDGYVIFAENAENAYDFGPDLADVVAEFLGKSGPYTAYKDGRITVR